MKKPYLSYFDRCILRGFEQRAKNKSKFWRWWNEPFFITRWEKVKEEKEFLKSISAIVKNK